jgi:histidinol-phosphatase (PHP family)
LRFSSLHVHTVFCDGEDEVETYCRAAWEGGFASLGFSAHAPIQAKTGIVSDWHLREDRLAEYVDAVRKAALRWAGRLPVYLGLEVDYIQDHMGPADADYRDMGLDYIIGSVHYVFPPNGGEPFAVDGPADEFARDLHSRFGGDGEAFMETYWETVEKMILSGGVDILGHLDLIKKNNLRENWFSPAGERYRLRVRSVAAYIARSGIVVEVNTGGINRGKTTDTYPSREILTLLREGHVPVIITADAHRVADIGGHYDDARQTLREAGYTHAVLFAGKGIWVEESLCPKQEGEVSPLAPAQRLAPQVSRASATPHSGALPRNAPPGGPRPPGPPINNGSSAGSHPALVWILTAYLIIVLAACASAPRTLTEALAVGDDFALLDPGGLAYLSLDIPQSRPVLDLISIGGLGRGQAAQTLDMTDTAAAAVYPPEDGRSFLLAARGRYPSSRLRFSLGLSSSWKKTRSKTGGRYWRSEENKLSLYVEPQYALISDGDPFPHTGGVRPPEKFAELSEGAVLAGWLPDAESLINRFLSGMQIPLAIPADILIFGVYPGPAGAEETDAANPKSRFFAKLRLELPSPSHVSALVSMISLIQSFIAMDAAGEERLPLAKILFANAPIPENSSLILASSALAAEEIALLFNMFSIYSR